MDSEELEPGEELEPPCGAEPAEDTLNEGHSDTLEVISSELEGFSEEEPSEGCSWGPAELPSEELEFISSEEEEEATNPGDMAELSEDCEEVLSEDSSPELEVLLAHLGWDSWLTGGRPQRVPLE